jgi:cation transport regulator ChaC
MEKETMYLKQQIEHLEQNIIKKESQIDQTKQQLTQDKANNDSKSEEIRKKF